MRDKERRLEEIEASHTPPKLKAFIITEKARTREKEDVRSTHTNSFSTEFLHCSQDITDVLTSWIKIVVIKIMVFSFHRKFEASNRNVCLL